jgi:GDPmannose 4,6-dehydratase
MQQEKPDDYVVATGEMHTVREFIEKAFLHVGRTLEWRGQGVHEEGIDTSTGKAVIKIDPRYFRPAEVEQLLGNPAKAKRQLGWVPEVTFEQLVKLMTDGDLRLLDKKGYEIGF